MKIKNCCHSILVVEDDDDIRESIKDFLEFEKYNVLMAANGREALTLLKTVEKPCLVLLDMLMPIMGGREFLDIVMKDTVLAPIPVLILSATVTKENSYGAVGFVKKPADLNFLLNVVKSYCGQGEAQ